ncbi:MAG: hypothetical protein GY943_26710 [Chloroflexi bacterium]|nr:hypothetical protein [Chloroflexota bacterium]
MRLHDLSPDNPKAIPTATLFAPIDMFGAMPNRDIANQIIGMLFPFYTPHSNRQIDFSQNWLSI